MPGQDVRWIPIDLLKHAVGPAGGGYSLGSCTMTGVSGELLTIMLSRGIKKNNGRVSERLGVALQKLIGGFDSRPYLMLE